MVIHGSAYLTGDLELLYRRTRSNSEAITRALAPFRPRLRGAPADLPFSWDARTVWSGPNFTLATDVGDIDLLGEVAGVPSYAQALSRAQLTEVYGVLVAVLDLDDLIASKRAAGRPRDLLHAAELEALRRLTRERPAEGEASP